MNSKRLSRRVLAVVAAAALAGGAATWAGGGHHAAGVIWGLGTFAVAVALLASIAGELVAGRLGVDAIALVAMAASLVLGETLAGAVVAAMYAGGNLLEDMAVARAESSLRSLIDRTPRIAHRRVAGGVEETAVDLIKVGDALLVHAGEVVPVDGAITGPDAVLDESALTGEPGPVSRRRGEMVRSGTLNAGEAFELRASASAGESAYARIVRLVSASQAAKSPFIRLADRYALLLLPVTLVAAGAAWLASGEAVRALAVLVAATPCPLILAAPVAFIAGVSQAARHGIIIKGGAALEALARTRTVMFDKTGTLTVGGARLIAVAVRPGESADDVLQLAGSLEQASHHVVAATIVAGALAKGLSLDVPEEVRETAGAGLAGRVRGRAVCVGSHQLVCGAGRPEDWARRVLRRASWRSALSVFVSVDGRSIGALLLGDELRTETPRAVQMLRGAGVARIVMVTGDRADAAETIGAALDLDTVLADRAPADKLDAVASERRLSPTLMVGDGINDAPALAAADVGIAMGARGASASSEAADVVILVDRVDRVADALVIAKRARAIALQSIVAGMALSGLAMGCAAFGALSPVAAALVQEAVDVAVILNALRALVPGRRWGRRPMPPAAAVALRQEHERLAAALGRLREIADALDDADAGAAVALIGEADRIVAAVVAHERADESDVYPRLKRFLADGHGLGAMSRAHREILHLARLLDRLATGLAEEDADRYLVRDAQRVIEAIDALARIHNAQEEEIYEHAATP
jgi:heavy metal translocating P-type ATPase